MSGEPDLVQGPWTRRSASIDGGPHFETQFVVWLQAGTCYADLRVPLHPAADQRCFTGRSFWVGDTYRWTHALDLEANDGRATPAADDFGDLRWDGDTLVETGMFPTGRGTIAYEEVWVRLPGGDSPWLALESPGRCLVRVGNHAITVVDARDGGGSFAAVYRVLTPEGWRAEATIGAVDGLPDPDTAADEPGWKVVHRGTREHVSS
jgi:hypothetical protein